MKAPKKLPRVLEAGEAQAILDACERLRDRFLFAVLHESGVRIGEALGLRHDDIAAERELTVRPRINDNRARTKSATSRTIPISAELVRLYADYLHEDYGDLDSDYVFINLWGRPHGHPMTYPGVCDLVRRLRRRTGIDFDPHWWRHTTATRLLRDGVPIEVVSKLLGHADILMRTALRLSDALRLPSEVLGREVRQTGAGRLDSGMTALHFFHIGCTRLSIRVASSPRPSTASVFGGQIRIAFPPWMRRRGGIRLVRRGGMLGGCVRIPTG